MYPSLNIMFYPLSTKELTLIIPDNLPQKNCPSFVESVNYESTKNAITIINYRVQIVARKIVKLCEKLLQFLYIPSPTQEGKEITIMNCGITMWNKNRTISFHRNNIGQFRQI